MLLIKDFFFFFLVEGGKSLLLQSMTKAVSALGLEMHCRQEPENMYLVVGKNERYYTSISVS